MTGLARFKCFQRDLSVNLGRSNVNCLFLIVKSHSEAETMNSYEQRKGSSQPPTKIESSQRFRSHKAHTKNVVVHVHQADIKSLLLSN